MNSDYNTFIHYIEKKMNVPYRFDKEFTGISIENGKQRKKKNIHFVRELENKETIPFLKRLDDKLNGKNLLNKTDLGKGQITIMSTKDVMDVISDEIGKNTNFLINKK